MDAYERVSSTPEINRIIDSINAVYKDILAACHGRYHAMFVVDTVEYILQALSYDAKTVELGKIAALLHDIGCIAGRRNHARKSAALAAVFLDDVDCLSPGEKAAIIQAIEDHSEGRSISSAVGAALLIADKVDISKERILPAEEIDPWHRNLLEIERVDARVSDKALSVNFITTDDFSKEMLINDYQKGFSLFAKAAEYLGCTCQFNFSGAESMNDPTNA